MISKERQAEPILHQHHPLSVELYLYTFQISHVLSSVQSSKTSHDPLQAATRKKPPVYSQHLSPFVKASSRKIVSKSTSRGTNQSPKKPEISTSLVSLGLYINMQFLAMSPVPCLPVCHHASCLYAPCHYDKWAKSLKL